MLAFAGGFAGVTWKWREAVSENKKAAALREFLTTGLLAQASVQLDPLGKNLPVQKLLDRTSDGLGFWPRPARNRGENRRDDRRVYLSLGRFDRADLHLKNAIGLDDELHGETSIRTPCGATSLLATLLDQTGHGTEAERLIGRARSSASLSRP